MPGDTLQWSMIVPLKPWRAAKSRLALDDDSRAALAEAFARDVLDVVAASEHVGLLVIVSAEPSLVVPQDGGKAIILPPQTTGLNAAIRYGNQWVRRNRSGPVAVMPGDLPSLTGPVLDHVLEVASPFDRAHVPDREGAGTTILTAADPRTLSPRYGPGSARRHALDGSHPMVTVDVRARCDVDTIADLAHVRNFGIGPHSAAAIRSLDFRVLDSQTHRKSLQSLGA